MPRTTIPTLSQQIKSKALEFGADVAGLAVVRDLKQSPSHLIYPKLPSYSGVGSLQSWHSGPHQVYWPEKARSCLVIGLSHPEDKPELDWWQEGLKGGTEGNEILISINAKLSSWLREKKGLVVHPLPYHLEKGGIFLKDAGVLAGLGGLSRSNLFLSPTFGPRIRLRALLLEEDLESTGLVAFDPCADCPAPCQIVCPVTAFDEQAYQEQKYQQDRLPARDGHFDRFLCNEQMEADGHEGERVAQTSGPGKLVINYCRDCELACPAGEF